MNKEDIIRMAQEAGFQFPNDYDLTEPTSRLERFSDIVAATERNILAAWMIQFGFATGHGDTMEQLVDALGSEIVDRIECEIDAEREACAKVCESYIAEGIGREMAEAIRARGQA